MRASERYWARVGGIFESKNDFTNELFSDEFRKGDGARPAGLGKYVIVKHQNHTDLLIFLKARRNPSRA